MSRSTAFKVINFVGFQAAWFACVFAAAADQTVVACLSVLAWIAVHVAMSGHRAAETKLIFGAGILGYVADSIVVLAGALSFPESTLVIPVTSVWMVMLWMNFATTLHGCLGWLRGRYILGALFGAIGGPLAYYAGARMGAIVWSDSLWTGIVMVAAEWAIATPLLLLFADRMPGHSEAPTRGTTTTEVAA